MKATIYDIAKKARVSHSTVSRVLNGGKLGQRSDSKARALKVLEIAEEMGYEPDSSAQSLTNRRTGNICFLISDNIEEGWANPYYAGYLKGVETSCLKNDYGLLINSYKLDCFKTFFIKRGLGQRKFDGLVVGGHVSDEMAELLNQHKVPFVNTGNNLERNDKIPSIYCHDLRFKILKYAFSKGHRHIGFTTPYYGEFWVVPLLSKAAADPLLKTMKIKDFFVENQDSAAGSVVFKEWIGMKPESRPTFLVQSHQTASFFLEELSKAGLKCPENVSLVSTSDSFVCQFLSPKLSVISNDIEKHGEAVADALIDHLENDKALVSQELDLPLKIIERQSVKNL